jgi:16S rRNA (guanine527-N7)-methyltransferase
VSLLSPEGIGKLLAEAGIRIPPAAAERLVRHAEMMLLWNRSIRLTAITRPDEVAVKHLLDSLLLLHFAPFPGQTLDFGSGAGYPGIPLAIVLPESRLVLLESSAKKCAFLSAACSDLLLTNARVVRGRLDAGNRLPIGSFERIVTRATRPPAEALVLLAGYLAPEGRLLLMTGPGERAKAPGPGTSGQVNVPGLGVTGRRSFVLPCGMGERDITEYARS